mgnify:FL=1
MNEYIIPIGIDGNNLQKGLKETIGVLEQVEAKSGEVGKTIDDAFQRGSRASEQFDDKMKSTSKNLEAIREMGKLAGKELADALSAKNINSSDFEKKLDGFKQKLSSLTSKVDIQLDDAKIKIFQKQIEGAKGDIEQLNVALKIANEVLAGLDTNSDEFQQLSEAIIFTETALKEFENEVVATTDKSTSMKTELRELQMALQQMEASGDTSSKQFIEMSVRAGELKDQIGDTAQQIRILSSDTKHVDALISGVTGLVGAFTAVQGATALFGAENEELNEALLKVNGAMAILQGLQAVQETLNKDSAFSVIFMRNARVAETTAIAGQTTALGANTVAMTVSTLATKAFSFALKTIGIGLILTAIALLVEYWDDLTAGVKKFLPAGADVGKMFDKIKSYAFGVGNAILQYVIAPIKALWVVLKTGDVGEGFKTYIDGMNVVKNYNEGFKTQEARNAQKYRDEQEAKNIEFAKRELERRKNRGEDTFKLEQRLRAREMSFNKRTGKEDADLKKEYEDAEDKRFAEKAKKSEDARKKANEQAKKDAEKRQKDAEEAHKKAVELQQKQNEQIAKFADELKNVEIRNIQDKTKRERASLEKSLDDKISAIEKEVALTEQAEEQKEKILSELRKEKADKLKEFDENAIKEKLKLELEGKEQLQQLQKDSLEKELELLKINDEKSRQAIEEKYKSEGELKAKLLEASEKNRVQKEKEIRDKYAKQGLKDEEEKAILSIELASTYAKKSEKTERQKQIALLNVKFEYAKKALDALIASGADENSLEVLRAKKIVQDTQNAVNSAVEKNNGRNFDFLEFLGIGEGLSDEENKKLRQAIGESMQVLSDFTSFMIDNYQEQMDKKAEQIDQTQSEIDDLEEKLDEEKSLREQGLANNVEVIEAEIEEKKRQKEEQIKQEEELLEKKKQMQKIQLALDTVQQLSGLITASVNIFEGFSTIPIVGIPLAIAMIGTMFGTFIATKAKAAQSINQQTVQYAEGGEIVGRSHQGGGEKYYSADGKHVKELEDGEFVVKKRQYGKFGKLVRAINEDDFSGLSINDYAIAEMFRQMGFDYDMGVGEARNLQLALMQIGYSQSESRHLGEISEGIAYLVEADKNTPKSWFDGVFDCVKVGNKVVKIKRENIKDEENES